MEFITKTYFMKIPTSKKCLNSAMANYTCARNESEASAPGWDCPTPRDFCDPC